MESSAPQALWPIRLADLAGRLRRCEDEALRPSLRTELWVVLHAALMRFLRAQAVTSRASREDLEDLAAAKALELLLRAESGAWNPEGRSADEMVGYVATMARHGLIDHARRADRETAFDPTDAADASRSDPAPDPGPETRVEAGEFARALRECFEALDTRARRVWFFRSYYEMSSRDIGEHPEVRIKAPHVDVVAQRARRALRDCMKGKGHDPGDAPPGAFVELWESLEALRARAPAPDRGDR
jgi:RNA polymerase sigma factor (sigma-70 family)